VVMDIKQTNDNEWSRYYRWQGSESVEILHAHFVSHRYARHVHDYFVIGLVENGAQSYWYRGARHTTLAGQIFLVNPDEPHTGEAAIPEGYVYRTLYANAGYLARVVEDIGGSAGVPLLKGSVLCDPVLATLLSKFHKCLASQASKVHLESLLFQSLARLITRHADSPMTLRPPAQERPAVQRAREYIEAHFATDLTLSTLADVVSLSPYYFARAFEREVGLPPHTYLEGVRIRKAREFLDRGETLVSAALLVGYSDQSHLTRRFKRFLGFTPGKYAKTRLGAIGSCGSAPSCSAGSTGVVGPFPGDSP
jgi:AraC-like DNA-binding protein